MASAFLITPFSADRASESEDVFSLVQHAIRLGAAHAGVDLVHPKDMSCAGVVMDQVREEIEACELVIANLTGENPNVYYEAGIADAVAMRPPILLLAEAASVEEIPFDVRALRIIRYSQQPDTDSLAAEIRDALEATLRLEVRASESDERYAGPPDIAQGGRAPRPWLIDEIDRFLAEEESGYFVLEAQAGMGKTWLLAELVESRGYPHYFCRRGAGFDSALAARRQLCRQLRQAWGLGHGRLSDDPDLLGLLDAISTKRVATDPGAKIVFVVDALDEMPTGRGQNVMDLPRHLPRGVYAIVSRRPGVAPLRADPAPRRLIVRPDDQRNREDLHRMLELSLSVERSGTISGGPSGEENDLDIAERLLAKSEGLWIYLKHVLPAAMRDGFDPDQIDSLPAGLWLYYTEYWQAVRGEKGSDWDSLCLPLLAALGASREPTPATALCEIAGTDRVDDAIALLEVDWSPFVSRTGPGSGEGRFTLYHATLGDFLAGSFDLTKLGAHDAHFVRGVSYATRSAHSAIADRYLERWGGLSADLEKLRDESSSEDEPGLRHVVAHLAAAERLEDLYEMLHIDWPRVEKRVRRKSMAGRLLARLIGTAQVVEFKRVRYRNAWFEVHRQDITQYLEHLEAAKSACILALQRGTATEPSASLIQGVYYTLLDSSVRSIGRALSPEMIQALCESNHWTPEEALTHVNLVSATFDPYPYLNNLSEIIGSSPATHLRALIRLVENPANRAHAAACLSSARGGADGFDREIDEALSSVHDPRNRAMALAQIAVLWPGAVTASLAAVMIDALEGLESAGPESTASLCDEIRDCAADFDRSQLCRKLDEVGRLLRDADASAEALAMVPSPFDLNVNDDAFVASLERHRDGMDEAQRREIIDRIIDQDADYGEYSWDAENKINERISVLAPVLTEPELEFCLDTAAAKGLDDPYRNSDLYSIVASQLDMDEAASLIRKMAYTKVRAASIRELVDRADGEIPAAVFAQILSLIEGMSEECRTVRSRMCWDRFECLLYLMTKLDDVRFVDRLRLLSGYWRDAVQNVDDWESDVDTVHIAMLPDVVRRAASRDGGSLAKDVVFGISRLGWFHTPAYKVPCAADALDAALPHLSARDQRRAFRRLWRQTSWPDVSVQLYAPFVVHGKSSRFRSRVARKIAVLGLESIERFKDGGFTSYKPDLRLLGKSISAAVAASTGSQRASLLIVLMEVARAGKSSSEAIDSEHGFDDSHRSFVVEELVKLSSESEIPGLLDIVRRVGDQDESARVVNAILNHEAEAQGGSRYDKLRHALSVLISGDYNSLTKIEVISDVLPQIREGNQKERELAERLLLGAVGEALSVGEVGVLGRPMAEAFRLLAPVMTEEAAISALERLERKYKSWDSPPIGLDDGVSEILVAIPEESRREWVVRLRLPDVVAASCRGPGDGKESGVLHSLGIPELAGQLCDEACSSRTEVLKRVEKGLSSLAANLNALDFARLRLAIWEVTEWFE